MTTFLLTIILCSIAGALVLGAALAWLFRRGMAKEDVTVHISGVAERVRAVGKLVGLEVHAKEIATAKRGWSWCPPVLISQAKLAMIFRFEKQYAVNLAAIREGDVEQVDAKTFRVRMPEVEGSLRLLDVQPYDIQQGKMLGLLDVIPMNAERQTALIKEAQHQAGELFRENDTRYMAQARDAVERQLSSLLAMFGITLIAEWPEPDAADREGKQPEMEVDVPRFKLVQA